MSQLRTALAAEERTVIVIEQDTYLHAEARSRIFGFVDDVEFLFDAERRVIHIRSAARSGYSDFGVNRRRVERIRRAYEQSR